MASTSTLYRLPSGDHMVISADWSDPACPVIWKGPSAPGYGSTARWESGEMTVGSAGDARTALAQLLAGWGPAGFCSPHGPYDLTAAEIADDAVIVDEETD